MSNRTKRQRRSNGPTSRRSFSLRTLFLVSICLTLPFLLVANLVGNSRPEDSVRSPTYLALGVFGVLLLATLGNVFGDTKGTVVATFLAGAVWFVLIFLGAEFSVPLSEHLPQHIVAIIITIGSVSLIAIRHKEPPPSGTSATIQELIDVKQRLRTQLHKPDTGDGSSSRDASSLDSTD